MFIKQVIKGIFTYIEAVRLLSKLNLVKYIIILLGLLSIFMLPVVFIDFFISMISSFIPLDGSSDYAQIVVKLMSNSSGFILLLFLSPLFSMVSEEVIAFYTGETYTFSLKQLIKDIVRGIKITIRNLFYQYVLVLLVSLIILLFNNILFEMLGKWLIIITTAYFYGFTLLDYALENYRLNYKESVSFIRKNKGLAVGLGLVYYFIIFFPDSSSFTRLFGHIGMYWSSFMEAIIVFIGIISASIITSELLEIKKK